MPKPNLLFIFTDEQRADTLAAYGNNKIHMPNLNRLAAQSTVFTQAYVTQPVCTPSRSSLLCGLYPHSNGLIENNIALPASIPCLPEMVEDREYATGYVGKWHLGDEIFAQHGFSEWRAIDDEYNRYYSPDRDQSARSTYHHWLLANGFRPENGHTFNRRECARLPEQFGKPAYVAREASRFLRENKDRPFILYVNFFEPHMPFFGPRDDQYDPAAIPLPANFNDLPDGDNPFKTRLFQQHYYINGHSGQELKTEADWRRMIAHYWGLCSLVDTHAGTILNTLDECGLSDNTIVVFTSDHGDMMGSHRLLAKCVMFEEAARVPFLVRIPGQHVSHRVSGPVSQIDVVPTLLDLLGQPIPPHLQGKSLAPLLRAGRDAVLSDDVVYEWQGHNNGLGDVIGSVSIPAWMAAQAPREQIVAATVDPVRTIVTPDGWKFNCSPLGEHELYNLKSDPHEMVNLARLPEHKPLLHNLLARIRRWQVQTKDEVSLRVHP
jgi:arylsulfatase A-like enzyme